MYVYMHVGDSVNGSTAPTATSRSKWYRKSFPEKGFQIYCALLSLIMGSLEQRKTPIFSTKSMVTTWATWGKGERLSTKPQDTICIAPGLINVYEKRNNWHLGPLENLFFARNGKQTKAPQTPSTKQMVLLLKDFCCIQPETWGNDERYDEFLLMGWNHKRLLSIRLGERVATGVSAWTVVIVMKVFVTLRGESEKLPTDIS